MSTNPADAYAEKMRREREANPITIDRLDDNVLASEPGRRMMEGAFESDSVYSSYAPANMPAPMGFGEFKENPDTWFYVCEFHDMIDELPDVSDLVNIVAKVHRASMGKSPTGKFGFAVPTHLANIPNDNTWQDTWEKFFTQAMCSMYEFEKSMQGVDEELDGLFNALCDKVIPRLLRPLESIEPCLVHSDLWPGNCMPDADTGELMLFDSCAFWGHNEAELGPWRAPRYRLGRPYLEQYQKVMGMSEPHADWEDRNALYALRYDFLVSALYPNETKFREMARKEMRALVEKFPNGLQEETKLEVKEYHDQTEVTEHSGEIELDPEIIAGKLGSFSVRD
ncbi:Fructosamine kinase-domain-containing protein [Lophiotrema nucula]|uniref:protein-ribulosamine 3-kinase n=1 Tax=Lophiotrema nucula TaxID=690887 RepID=A0A6A5Z2C4_9PLEO|nr:Fructosamine kinase-domain-containing protein [Lophiotrema nucula]